MQREFGHTKAAIPKDGGLSYHYCYYYCCYCNYCHLLATCK